MSAIAAPFSDITNIIRSTSKPSSSKNSDTDCRTPFLRRPTFEALTPDVSQQFSPEAFTPYANEEEFTPSIETVVRVYQNDPYNWRALPADEHEADLLMGQHLAARLTAGRFTSSNMPLLPHAILRHQAALALQALLRLQQPVTKPVHTVSPPMEERQCSMEKRDSRAKESPEVTPAAPEGDVVCQALIQFKCHQAEYNSTISVSKGQYVVVQGDRGIDIGLVNRVNSDQNKQFIERTGPVGAVLRHATTQEVEYWATDLKKAEEAAVDFCRQRVIRNNLNMEVRHAEYQYDKNKLTFYYEARSRVDFVTLLKELYRQFGCRIWMEKVRAHE